MTLFSHDLRGCTGIESLAMLMDEKSNPKNNMIVRLVLKKITIISISLSRCPETLHILVASLHQLSIYETNPYTVGEEK